MRDYIRRLLKVKPAVVKVMDSKTGEEGSGFVVDKKGLVITANHVVLNASDIIVHFHEGSEKYCTKIAYTDPTFDLAILKIPSGDYQALNLGTYENLREGNEVYFCGYPLLSSHHCINHGMVSALFSRNSKKVIQIDGSINSGNSGGPLLDMNDTVVGVIVQKEGGVDEKLMSVCDKLRNAFGRMLVDEPRLTDERRICSPHPNKTLVDIIFIIRHYTNVGIGYAYSIEYVKAALANIAV